MTKELDKFFTEPEETKVEIQSPPVIKWNDLDNPYFIITAVVPGTSAQTATNYGVFFTAPFSCQVIEAWETHDVSGSDAGNVTLTVEKLTTGQSTNSGVEVLSGTFDLKASDNTPQRQKAKTIEEDITLNPGDRLALKDSGTLTQLSHVSVTVLLKVLQTELDQS